VHDAWPDKHLLFTEGCQEGGPHHGQWEVGERYARSMIADINRWTVGWIDWNLCLDMQGGPNHVGNFCSAPLLVDAAAGLVHRQSAYFYIGHFARFAKPGARRILCAADDARLETTGFLNPDGSLAVVVLNRTGECRDFVLRLGDTDWRAHLPPRAIATYALAATPISSG
jgi:glucosylceramidase